MTTNGHYPPSAAPPDYLKVKKLSKIGDTSLGQLDVEKFSIGSITFGMPYLGNSIALPEVSSATIIPQCKPSKPTAEQMLKKALEFAYKGMEETECSNLDPFSEGMYVAYEITAAHLEMLIKEAKQNG